MKRSWVIAATVVAVMAVLGYVLWETGRLAPVTAALGLTDGEEPASDGAARPTPVAIAETRTGVAVERFRTSGAVIADDSVMLATESPGRVGEIHVEAGDRLRRGDPVLRFEDGPERADVQAARARLSEAEADLARQRELKSEQVVAEAQVETARARARAARARVASAEAALDDMTVRAPFDGRIGFLRVSEGAYLAPGDPIAAFASVDRLRVRFTLPQEAADAARDAGTVRLEDAPEACAEPEIAAISPLEEPETRARPFEAALPEACGLQPGAFVTVSVPIARREDAVFAPHAALVRQGFDAWLFRVEDGDSGLVARRAPVETGVFAGPDIEIRDGVAAGARIVASGVQKIADGDPVVPMDDAAGGGGGGGAGAESGGSGRDGAEPGGSDDAAAAPSGDAASDERAETAGTGAE